MESTVGEIKRRSSPAWPNWNESLYRAIKSKFGTNTAFVEAMNNEVDGLKLSKMTVTHWIRGTNLPRPYHRVIAARVLGTEESQLFNEG